MAYDYDKKSIPDLPAEVQDEIIAYWDPVVLAKFAQCCKKHRTIASNFSTRHHGAQHAYGKYFTSHEIGELQDLQADTGLIVAGISVLNFFIHASFPSPLDTFCHIDHCITAGTWYIAKEYTYRPQQGQQSSFQKDIIRVKELLRKSRSDDVDDTADFQEVLSGIVETWSFRKGRKEVRLVASSGSPLEVVFSFPSTCLMNVFTHRAAYCLFPLLTLVNDIGLINSVDVTLSVQQQSHIEYFTRHGYTFLDMPSIAMTIDADTALSFLSARSVGDKHCHVIKFNHFGRDDPKPDYMEAHSWNMSYHSNSTSLSYLPFSTYESRFEYAIAPQLWDSTIAKLNILARLEGQSLLLADVSILCSQVLSRPEVLEQTKKDPMWITYHRVLTALFDMGGDIASDTAHDLFTLFFTITERYPGSTLAINKEASTPSTSPVPKVSLTLSIPGDVFKPAEKTGFEKWLNMFKASSIFFAIDVLQ